MRSLALGILVFVGGCNVFFSDGDDECKEFVGTNDIAPANQLRNPQTGVCEPFGGGGTCNDRCGPCPATDLALPDWGSCFSNCEGLAEDRCQETTGCLAAYTDFPNADAAPKYRGCYQTAPSGPVRDGACRGLDAQQCSRHDNCTIHYGDYGDTRAIEFEVCLEEKPITPLPACSTLTTENACAARADCERIYQGTDCTCTPTACDCNVLTYQHCQTK